MDWVLPLVTLSLMEVVLGIDNIIFLSILISALPAERQKSARALGLGLALGARVGLLFGIQWVMKLQTALFHWNWIGWVPDIWLQNKHVDEVTGRDLVLLLGGAFLLTKSVLEIHKKTVGNEEAEVKDKAKAASYGGIIAQIIVLDLVFSLDSVISAIGMVDQIWIMIVAMLVAVGFMAAFAAKVDAFIHENPTFKMLALSFLVLISVMLLGEGLGSHIPKGYIYSAMAFAVGVEALNMRVRRKKDAKAVASRR